MPTNGDYYDALLEGRWRPEIEVGVKGEPKKEEFYARYTQGETVVEETSPWNPAQAEENLMRTLREGVLEGKYYPEG